MREDPVLNAPVRGLQLMLRTIAFADGVSSPVIADGIYGDSTARAVSDFQASHQLPVTGITDEASFTAIVAAYNAANELLSPVQAGVVFFPQDLSISLGQSHPHLFLAQSMLYVLCRLYPAFLAVPPSGTMDSDTQSNLRLLQGYAGLPVTGQLNLVTWNRLNMLYRAAFDRNFQPTQG